MRRRKALEVARAYLEPYAGDDFTRPVKEALRLRAEMGDEAAIASMGPAWSTLSPEIEWDVTPLVGGNESIYRGFGGFLDYWAEWLDLWDEYVYETLDYSHAEDWVVADVSLRATGRAGLSIDMQVAQACEVRDMKIVRMKVFPTVADAEAGLGQPRRSGVRRALGRKAGRS